MLKSGVGSSMITNNKVDKRIKDLDDIVLYPPLSFFFSFVLSLGTGYFI